jgi:hypothetical protein
MGHMLKWFTAALLAASPAFSDGIDEWETVFEQDSWRLDVNTWDDGSLSCETRSVSEDGTLFSVESWPDGSFSITLYNENWQFPEEAVDETFVVRIDGGDPWDISAEKYSSSVTSYLDRTEPATQRFLTAFYSGSSMLIESAKGTAIAQYALSGTGPTMDHHSECEDLIGTISATIEADPGAKLAKETF